MDPIVERCCGLDVHKDLVVACVRVPSSTGERKTKIAKFSTFTKDLLALRDWLVALRVTRGGMEATGVYWKPVVRHEALIDRVEMKGLHLRIAAAQG